MAGKKSKISSNYGLHALVYSVGPWYVLVNHVSKQCQITSGDVWYDIPRSEAANWLRHGSAG